ncbi:MAG TPA: hypothetical protein VHB98_10770, partial [Chloroflexota bacterium]|nr:hypothetical protein [Chloroflexota bacterium]
AEARLSAGNARVTGTIGVAINASSPLVRSLSAGTLPNINGYAATVLKTQAVADLVTHVQARSADPVLAHWQYGLGRVAVWTPGSSAAWAASWLTNQSEVWNDTVRWLARGPSAATLTPRLQMAGDSPLLVVDTEQNSGVFVNLANLTGQALAPNGSTSHLTLTETGPGLYEAALPGAAPGVYGIRVQQSGTSSGQVRALVAVPYAREYVPSTADQALLSQLAAQTGGVVLRASAQLPASHTTRSVTSDQDLWWALVALALLLFLVDVVLRQSDWGRPAPA